jgi:hypothetical protein
MSYRGRFRRFDCGSANDCLWRFCDKTRQKNEGRFQPWKRTLAHYYDQCPLCVRGRVRMRSITNIAAPGPAHARIALHKSRITHVMQQAVTYRSVLGLCAIFEQGYGLH